MASEASKLSYVELGSQRSQWWLLLLNINVAIDECFVNNSLS